MEDLPTATPNACLGKMYDRFVAARIQRAREDTPVILLVGARQTGKSTLARQAAQTRRRQRISLAAPSARAGASAMIFRYFTLDDANTRAQLAADAQSFVEQFRSNDWTVIDEAQRAPSLLTAIKREIDLDRRPGRYLLTGSADPLALPSISESLAGRVEVLSLWPLAQSEIAGHLPSFLSEVFETTRLTWTSAETREAILRRALVGGYPEAVARADETRRSAWFGNYVSTVVAREVKEIASIEDQTAMVRVLRATASRSGGPLVLANLSVETGIPQSTMRRYVALLQATFMISELPPWLTNVDARIIKAPKLLLNDSGLYAYLLGITSAGDNAGFLLETFIGAELQKLISWSQKPYALMHFRTRRSDEVDFVVEAADRRIVGIEVKSATTVTSDDFRGLRVLKQLARKKFVRGLVLYCGRETLSFGDDLWAIPIPSLWA